MSQKNTLFNYFGSPVSRKSLNRDEKSLSSVPDNRKNKSTSVSKTSRTSKERQLLNDKQKKDVKVHEVVWSKLDGYPWWPSLTCNHPKLLTHIKEKEIHVQFFDDPPSRAWVKRKFVEAYTSSAEKPIPSKDIDKWTQATLEAEKALKLSPTERKELVVPFPDEGPMSDTEDQDDEDGPNSTGVGKENLQQSPASKRRRVLVLDSEDSADDYKPGKEDLDVESESASSGVDSGEDDVVNSSANETETPVKKRKRDDNKQSVKKAKKNLTSEITAAKLTIESTTPKAAGPRPDGLTESWSHLKLDFLKPDKIRDAKRRKPDDSDYDPRTLFVPDDFLKNSTPAMKQWWEMKSSHFDCVLFFKVGKFYELYHMDAVVGVRELGLLFMKGENAHSGFPEIAYGRYSTSLVEKGFKLARVEQTETPDMMAERCKGMFKVTKFDKVVKREICQVTTRGTRTFSVLDGDVHEAEAHYLLALTEQAVDMTTSSYGVCFIDTSIGVFNLGQFTDDRYCSHLRTLLARHPPVQVLFERGALSDQTRQLLATTLASAIKEPLAPGSEFWSAEKTLLTLAEGSYFASGVTAWPEELKCFLSDADSLGLTARDGCELAVRALGAVTWYLQQCHLEQQLLAMGRFTEFRATDASMSGQSLSTSLPKNMVLDGVTLKNLDVLETLSGDKGALLQRLDFCCTPFGKRLLRQWVCTPLCDATAVACRQSAVSELLKNTAAMKDVRSQLSALPDLERLLARIHAQGNAVRSKMHPDSRAIFYEDRVYSKKKIMDFISTLNGFKCANKIAVMFEDTEIEVTSKLLLECTSNFPDVSGALKFFDTAFDHEEAEKAGRIIPRAGVDPEYDAVNEELKRVQAEIAEYLEKQKQFFGCKVTYFGSDKKRFQLEVHDAASKKAGREYELQSQRKGYKRYWTPQIKELLARLIAAEEHKKTVLKDLSRRIFEQFSSHCDQWNSALQCLSVLDVLLSLAEYTRSEQGDTCVPEIVTLTLDDKPFVDIRGGRHPCISSMEGFVSNDTSIGSGDEASLVLVTGPNMGGKSTLMRQLGLLIIMAQMGCPIPATHCRLSLVDRIFTRLGASDDIMAGESTFFVELSETSAIFQQATKHSLVLVDELGRGTSTYDGTAIAAAVVRELAQLSCRTLFSTHYHTLVDDFRFSPQVALGHMACMVENECESDGDPSRETVTFLYKFAAGACPKSYGFNAALLGGIPAGITQRAYRKAVQLEGESDARLLFRHLCTQHNLTSLLARLKTS